MDIFKLHGTPTKINRKMEPNTIFYLLFCISFYISKYFLELHSTSEKKIYNNFPFLTDLLKPPHPFISQNLLSMTKVFCQYSVKQKVIKSFGAVTQWLSCWIGAMCWWLSCQNSQSRGPRQLKACVCYFLSNFYFSPNDSSLKTMKNVFYFI